MLWHLNENRKKLEKFPLQFTVIWNWHRKKKFSPRNKQNCEFAKVKKKKKEKKSPNFSCFIVTRLEQSKLINMKCPVKQNFNRCSHWTHNCLALFTAFWGGGVVAEREIIRRQQNVKGRLKLTTDEGGGDGVGGGGNHKNITEPYGGSGKLYRDTTKFIRLLPGPHPLGDK